MILTSASLAALTHNVEASALKYEARISYDPNNDQMKVDYIDRSNGAAAPVDTVWLAPGDRVTVTIDNTTTEQMLGRWMCHWTWQEKVDRDTVPHPTKQPFTRTSGLGDLVKVYVAAGPDAKRESQEVTPAASTVELGPHLGMNALAVAAVIDRKPPSREECRPKNVPNPSFVRGPDEIMKAPGGKWYTMEILIRRISASGEQKQ